MSIASNESSNNSKLSFKYALAGSLSGVCQKTIVQPLDLMRTRMQVNFGTEHGYQNLRQAFNSIVKTEGYKAMYTGLLPNLFGSAVSWGVYFQVYNTSKRARLGTRDLPAQFNFMCGALAGVTTSLTTNPIWMIKTRLQLQEKSAVNSSQHYKSATDALFKIIKEEGVLTLWKGILPGMALVVNGALSFMFYDEFKKLWKKYMLPENYAGEIDSNARKVNSNSDAEHSLNSSHFLVMGAASKILSTTITYPLQVFRARMYQRGATSGFIEIVKNTIAKRGLFGFYSGYVPHTMKTGIASAFTFFAYENILKFIESISSN